MENHIRTIDIFQKLKETRSKAKITKQLLSTDEKGRLQ